MGAKLGGFCVERDFGVSHVFVNFVIASTQS